MHLDNANGNACLHLSGVDNIPTQGVDISTPVQGNCHENLVAPFHLGTVDMVHPLLVLASNAVKWCRPNSPILVLVLRRLLREK